jgi:hypothetical protein
MMCFFLDLVLVDLHPYFFLKHEEKLHLLKINTKKFWPGHLFGRNVLCVTAHINQCSQICQYLSLITIGQSKHHRMLGLYL